MSEIKERPILFSGEMVRAILDGRKTQTRRVVNPQPLNCDHGSWPDRPDSEWVSDEDGWHCCVCGNGVRLDPKRKHGVIGIRSPYGQPGDRLWVRETFRKFDSSAECACYDDCLCSRHHGKPLYRADSDDDSKWTPSIFMPRWASRILLEVVSVRVERLQDISEKDALEEGITYNHLPDNGLDPMRARTWFRGLWCKINGYDSWDANPWVWVVEFRRVQP